MVIIYYIYIIHFLNSFLSCINGVRTGERRICQDHLSGLIFSSVKTDDRHQKVYKKGYFFYIYRVYTCLVFREHGEMKTHMEESMNA